jgi:hypothetical protein
MISLGREPQVLVGSQKTSSRGAATDGIDPMRCLSPLRGSNHRDGFGTWGSRPRLNIFRASGAPGFVIEFRLKGLWTPLQRKDQSDEGEDGEGDEDRPGTRGLVTRRPLRPPAVDLEVEGPIGTELQPLLLEQCSLEALGKIG